MIVTLVSVEDFKTCILSIVAIESQLIMIVVENSN